MKTDLILRGSLDNITMATEETKAQRVNIPQKYTQYELEDFVSAISRASQSMKQIDPEFNIVSLNGGLPLYDILGIVDRDFDRSTAIYFPGSSKIKQCEKVLTYCFTNLFLEKQDEFDSTHQRQMVALDEVVSGASVNRLFNAYNSGSREVARYNLRGTERRAGDIDDEAVTIRQKFPLTVMGIKEKREHQKMSRAYQKRVHDGDVMEFETGRIITMDDLDYQTVRFKHPKSSGFAGQCYYPFVKEFVTTAQYAKLLHDIAGLVGADHRKVDPSREGIITDPEKYAIKPDLS